MVVYEKEQTPKKESKSTPIHHDKFIRQANALTSAAYSLTRNERRLVYIAVDQISRNKLTLNELGQYPVVINNVEFADFFNAPVTNISRDINSAASSLNKKEVVFFLPDLDTDEEKALDAISWTTKRSVRPKQGQTTIYFNAELINIIGKVDKNFSRLLKGDIAKLEKPSAMRLYDTLKQWENLGKYTCDIDWMFERYEINPNYRERMSDFRRRFLKPALEEINDKTSLNVTHEELKLNNRVEKIKFIITSKAIPEITADSHNSNVGSSIEKAVRTYMHIMNKELLPSLEEVENLENNVMALISDGFEFGVAFANNLKEVKVVSEHGPQISVTK